MKKILSVCVMIIMVLSLSISAVAAPGAFVSSPSGNNGPTIEDFKPGDEGCTAEPVVTPYGDKDKLPEDQKEEIKNAYDKITNTKDITTLSEELEKLAKDKNIINDKLAVSDLFNINLNNCDSHDAHKNFEVTLGADALHNFVGLLAVNGNGEFVLVSDARVNGNKLTFTVGDYNTFAVVVDTSDVAPVDPPQTGDNLVIYIVAAVASVALVAVVVLIVVKRKKENV